jgi:hypothetical protein
MRARLRPAIFMQVRTAMSISEIRPAAGTATRTEAGTR